MAVDIVLYGVVAAGLVLWLRNVLGTRHGEERERPNPFLSSVDHAEGVKSGAAFTDSSDKDGAQQGMAADALDRNMSILPVAEAGLADIANRERNFSVKVFLDRAQDAFAMIVEAFADGDKELLQDLLTPALYKSFAQAIDQREQDELRAEIEIHAVRQMEIAAAIIQGKTAYITVRFTADETNLLYDKDGKLIQGNPDRLTETIDIWTFGRVLNSRDPAWYLYETRDEDASDQEHKTVPDGES